MVRVEFPVKLLEPEFLECLIRERPEDFVTKARITKAQKSEKFRHLFSTEGAYAIYKNGGRGEKISEFLDSIGLQERETLNGIALPGSCQFSCLADQLFGRACTRDWRADVLLRELAMFVIATNEDQFRCFMLHANPRTRSQNKAAGEAVDLEAYIQKMQKSNTDGDHLTLQALCDALQCPIHVLQVVDSPLAAHVIAQHDFKNVVINELHPRVLPHLHKCMSRLQVQRRELWLTLHGEAHFKSLHVSSYTEEEASVAKAELQVLQSTMPDPPPTPTLPNAPSSSSSSSSVTTAGGHGSPQADAAPQAQSIDTCSICLEDVDTDRRSLGTTGKAPSPVSAEPRGGRMQTRGGPEVPAKPDSCTHIFHYGCLCSWALLSSSCPNCKARFAAIDRLWGGRKTTVIHGKKGARNRLTEVSPTGESRSRVEEEEAEDEDDPNDPVRCYVCNRANNSNVLLLCDNYPRCLNSAHTWCLGLDNVPHGDWFCPSCQRARSDSVSNSDSTAARTGRSDRAERARRRRLAAEAAEGGGAHSSDDRGGDDGTTMRRVRTAGGEQEARRRQRVNVLAREIQDRHADNGITSTEPWARVLEAAHEAEQRVRVANGGNGAVELSRPAVGRRTPVQTQQQALVIDVEQEQLLQAFADREAALRLASQQQQAQAAAAAAAAGPSRSRSVYEISSDSDDGSGEMTARTASSRSSHYRGGRGGGGSMPNGVNSARAHMRPITVKRPRLAEATLPVSASTISGFHTFPPPPLSSSSSSSSSALAVAGSGGVTADGGSASNAISTTNTSSTQAPRAASPPPQPLSAKDPKNVLARLEAAVDADVASVASGWPPTEMAKLTGELSAIFSWDQRDQARLLNLGLLSVLRRFLEPIPGRPSFLPLHSKMVILRLLQALPIGMAHLRESGLNRVLLSVCTQPGEDKTVRDVVQGLISNWARFVFNVKLNGAASEIHKGRWHGRTSPHSPPAYRPTPKAPHPSASCSSTSSAAAAGSAAGGGNHHGATGISHGLTGGHHGGGGSSAGGGFHIPSSSSSSSLSVSGVSGGGKAPSYVTPYVPVTDPSRLFGAQKDAAFALPTFRM